MKMNTEIQNNTRNITIKLIPGVFSKCYYCDVDNLICRKYNQPKNGWNEIGDWTWENFCLQNGGCDR